MEAKKKNTGKKMLRIPDKKGINLIQNEEKHRHLFLTIILVLVVIGLLEIGIKYGVLDLYTKLNKAADDYDAVHVQYVAAENALRDYDDVLMEYRTYSMDWMEKDTSGKYVSVDRRDVLDLIESKMRRVGEVETISISGSNANVEMSGMDLRQISQMCAELETSPIVESAILMSAGTNDKDKVQSEESEDGVNVEKGDNLSFNILIRLQSAEEEQEG